MHETKRQEKAATTGPEKTGSETATTDPIIRPGKNCWRHESAHRVAFLVDAADYFAALYDALHKARESVWILGWDIHSRTRLLPDRDGLNDELAQVLHEITRRNRNLHVRILTWDPAPIYFLEREFAPQVQFAFRTNRRVHLRYASDHLVGASHHQKMAVIDDRHAFVGGIDLTINRWDTRDHHPDDPGRVLPSGTHYKPFHDAQLAVDGDAARALGDLARQRWHEATGQKIDACQVNDDPWPDRLQMGARDVKVALARTQAAYEDRPAINEVEKLFVDSIAAARKTVYIENQYLTSSRVCDALVHRLRDSDGPEIVIVTPRAQAGRLTERSMGALRVRVVRRLREADRHGRLRIYSAVVGDDVPINIHAKIMVIDDRLLRIGSANLSNRSMNLDSECDAAIEAHADDETRKAIRQFRDGLLAEHLGRTTEEITAELERTESLVKAVDELRGGSRTLEDLDVESAPELSELETMLADPEQPIEETLSERLIPEQAVEGGRSRLPRVVLALFFTLVIAGLAAWWSLADGAKGEQIVKTLEPLRGNTWGPLLAILILALAALIMLPVNALIIAVVFVFGPWIGAGVSMAGSLISAAAGYGLGKVLWRDTVRRWGGRRMEHLATQLGKRGLGAVIVIRMLPAAPFTVVNLAAGSTGVRLRDFLLGTLIGMAPGIAVVSFASDRVIAAARSPEWPLLLQAGVAVLLLVVGTLWLYRFLNRKSQ